MSGRVHRVLVRNLEQGETELLGPEAHHLANVLRVKPGELVEAFDGEGNVAAGSIAGVTKQSVSLSLGAVHPAATEARTFVTVAVALLKADKLSDVVRQCTELGAVRFALLTTQHADLASLSPARLLRLRRVAEEASRQSGRATVPVVEEPVALSELRWRGVGLVAHPEARESLGAVLAAATAPGADERTEFTVITGPEGGFSRAEVEELEERGAHAVRFGPRILRAETAPVALSAALLLLAGE